MLTRLNEMGRPTVKVGSTMLWAGGPNCIQRRKQANAGIHLSLLPDCGYKCDHLPHIPVAMTPPPQWAARKTENRMLSRMNQGSKVRAYREASS